MKIVFMGTPDFAVGTFEALVKAGHEILLAVTQPDKPKGRGKALQFSPVKESAIRLGIPVYQPRRVREVECVEYLRGFHPDLIVVAAFGQILPKEILDMPKYGCINVHASLLPKYRGAAPIQWAVLNGDEISGVTIMQMDEGLDTGDILETVEVPLSKEETGGSLFEKLADAGAGLCVEVVGRIGEGRVSPRKQDGAKATHVGMIAKDMGKLDWTRPARELERWVRGLNPWPSAYTTLQGKTLKIWRAEVVTDSGLEVLEAGTVVETGKEHFYVQTGEGLLDLKEVQLQGKKRMPADAFLRGHAVEPGTVLGE